MYRNNTGSSLQSQFCDDITLTDTRFLTNNNQLVAELDMNKSIEELNSAITTAGGFTFFSRGRPVKIVIQNSSFIHNSANKTNQNNTPPVLKTSGHGGAILIRLADVQGSEISITNSSFENNTALVDGGAIYISLSENASTSSILLAHNRFLGNQVEEASGGAVSINSLSISFNNTIVVENCNFTNNKGNAGGAFSMALYDSNIKNAMYPDSVIFTDCHFLCNEAKNEGTAIGLFSLIPVDQIGFPVRFKDW